MTLSLLRRGDAALRIGHRGAAALAPENTLESFALALDHGLDGVEFDVHGRVVSHDPHGAGPSLDEALAFFAERDGSIVQVDVKVLGHEAELVEALREFGLVERALVSSFHVEALRGVAELEPSLARSFTYPEDRMGLATRRWLTPAVRASLAVLRRALPRRVGRLLRNAGAGGLTVHYTLVTRALIDACHARGAAVWAWTVNEATLAATLEELGADAIITDDPRIFGAAPAFATPAVGQT